MSDIRLKHNCRWHLVPNSLVRFLNAGAKYYKYDFQIECTVCHTRQTVHCKNLPDAESKQSSYPVLPVFPK